MKEATEGAGAGVVRDADFWAKADRHLIRYARGDFAPVIIERAAGSYVYDSDGRAILDFTSGQMSALLGHSHPAVVEAVSTSIAQLDHLFSGMLSRPVVELATALAETLPDSLSKTMLLSTGGESNEAAIRLAKLVTGRHEIVAFDRGYHGVTHAASAATFAISRAGYGPVAPGNMLIPTPDSYRPGLVDGDRHDWRTELDRAFAMVDRISVGSLAAFIAEPILSTGGIIVPPPGYFAALAEKCREREMLLIFDEAQTGLGRTGDFYAFEHDDVVPDILTLSKTLGGGLPLSAVITSEQLEAAAHERGSYFLTTHVSDPLAASVGLAILQELDRMDGAATARRVGQRPSAGLAELQQRHDRIGDVRGRACCRASNSSRMGRQGAGGRLRLSGDSRLSRRRPASQHRPVPRQQQHPADRAAADDLRCRTGPRSGDPRFGVDDGGCARLTQGGRFCFRALGSRALGNLLIEMGSNRGLVRVLDESETRPVEFWQPPSVTQSRRPAGAADPPVAPPVADGGLQRTGDAVARVCHSHRGGSPTRVRTPGPDRRWAPGSAARGHPARRPDRRGREPPGRHPGSIRRGVGRGGPRSARPGRSGRRRRGPGGVLAGRVQRARRAPGEARGDRAAGHPLGLPRVSTVIVLDRTEPLRTVVETCYRELGGAGGSGHCRRGLRLRPRSRSGECRPGPWCTSYVGPN